MNFGYLLLENGAFLTQEGQGQVIINSSSSSVPENVPARMDFVGWGHDSSKKPPAKEVKKKRKGIEEVLVAGIILAEDLE